MMAKTSETYLVGASSLQNFVKAKSRAERENPGGGSEWESNPPTTQRRYRDSETRLRIVALTALWSGSVVRRHIWACCIVYADGRTEGRKLLGWLLPFGGWECGEMMPANILLGLRWIGVFFVFKPETKPIKVVFRRLFLEPRS